MPVNELDNRFKLTDIFLQMWKYPYPSKWVRYAYHEIKAREARGIPSPME